MFLDYLEILKKSEIYIKISRNSMKNSQKNFYLQ